MALNSNGALDAARGLGDPRFDEAARGNAQFVHAYLKQVKDLGLAGLTETHTWQQLTEQNEFVKAAFDSSGPLMNAPLSAATYRAMNRAKVLFALYGEEISGALLMAALPEAFAAGKGARVLTTAKALVVDVRVRIRGTAQFLMLALVDEEGDSDETRWARSIRAAYALRLHHAAVRYLATNSGRMVAGDGVAINQEDLLGTLLTFTVTVFEVLEKLGVEWSPQDQQEYLIAWDHIGSCMGIAYPGIRSDANVARPSTVAEARKLLDRIRARQWTDPSALDLDALWTDTEAGRMLIHALLNELTEAMPRGFKSLPATVMRQYVPEIVRNRLGLGDGGLVELALETFPLHARRTDGFAQLPRSSRLGRLPLRATSNFVTRCSISHFVRGPGPRFVIPRLEDWIDGIRHPV